MSFGPRDYLQHMLGETDYLLRASEGVTREAFLENETLQRAFVRSIEILGEAAKKLPDHFRDAYPQVEWRAMARMRDRLIHGYFGVDLDVVWDVIESKIPELHNMLRQVLDEDLSG